MADDGFYLPDELPALGFREVGAGVQVSRKACFYHFSGTIGDHSRIDDFVMLKGRVDIKRHVHISAYCMISAMGGPVLFEDCSTLSCRVSVYTASDDYRASVLNNPTVPERFKRVIAGGVRFGIGCIVGAHTLILPNASLGDGCSVGAFALVDRPIAEGEIVISTAARLEGRGYRDVEHIRALRDEVIEWSARGKN